MSLPRVLVCDSIAREGIEALARGARVEERTDITPEGLLEVAGDVDGLVVRSRTRITAEVIGRAKRLRVVGRAGTGVDVAAATEKGIVVVNAPTGNTVSAAEHTLSLLLALARNVTRADASLRAGRWERERLMGVELTGKTLGLVGLGQVGAEVARRARGFDMRILANDPFVPEERAQRLGVELVPLDRLLAESDFVSLHVLLSESTRGLLGEREIARMKPGARLVNTARGGLVDEAALLRAIEEGRIAGAALDVFAEEPPRGSSLLRCEKVVLTPHLGASTTEAQERVALDVAEQILAVLAGSPARSAVNVPLVPPETLSFLAPHMAVATKTASIATQLCAGQLGAIEIDYAGDIAAHDTTPLRAAAIRGLLAPISTELVNVVNADLVARRRGLRIEERRSPSQEIYNNLVTVRLATSAGAVTVSGTLAHDGPHVVRIEDFWVDVPPTEGYLLLCRNRDRPGMIGAVGTLLGSFDVNISFMNVGRTAVRGDALMVLTLDDPLSPDQLRRVTELPDILNVRLVRL
jgi:D-3-phosphoglycerate dehydrogenase